MVSKEVEKLLLKVQKPGRYVGGELNAVVKNKKDAVVVLRKLEMPVAGGDPCVGSTFLI